jgi:hypothetical protein
VTQSEFVRRKRQGATRWARSVAFIALIAYLAVALWGSLTKGPTLVMILSVAFLWGAGVVLMWSTLRSRRRIGEVAIGTSALLVASAYLMFGGAVLFRPLSIVQLSVAAIFLLAGFGASLFALGVLRYRADLLGAGFILFGIAGLLLGGAGLLTGAIELAGFVPFGVGILLLGVSLMLEIFKLGGIGFLLVGTGGLFNGVALMLVDGTGSEPMGFLLLGAAGLLGSASMLLDRLKLFGVALLGLGASGMLLADVDLRSQSRCRKSPVRNLTRTCDEGMVIAVTGGWDTAKA